MTGASDWSLWALSFGALAAVYVLVGGRKAFPVLGWVALFFWIPIVGDLISADLANQPLAEGALGPYAVRAIVYSLAALLALAVGMRSGTYLGSGVFGAAATDEGPQEAPEQALNLQRVVTCYFISMVVVQALNVLARALPSFSQPLLAIALVHYVVIYLLAATVFQTRRGYGWLALMAAIEVATGMVSYFASYKEPIFVILLALVSTSRALNVRQVAIGALGILVVFWMSLVWSGIKMEYRTSVVWKPTSEKVAWLAGRYLSADTDYSKNAVTLFRRIGYTTFYSMILARDEVDGLPRNSNFYGSAIGHIATPRFLFPNKAALSDSRITTQLLGIPISDKTSIGVGYVAQAHVDFRFPGLLAALWAIGAMLGFAAQYFMTRAAPFVVRSAFTTAALFMSFPFAANIDKALGGFLISWIGMMLVLKFGYPMLAQWLAGAAPTQTLQPFPAKAAPR
jgi:hypothetical protein